MNRFHLILQAEFPTELCADLEKVTLHPLDTSTHWPAFDMCEWISILQTFGCEQSTCDASELQARRHFWCSMRTHLRQVHATAWLSPRSFWRTCRRRRTSSRPLLTASRKAAGGRWWRLGGSSLKWTTTGPWFLSSCWSNKVWWEGWWPLLSTSWTSHRQKFKRGPEELTLGSWGKKGSASFRGHHEDWSEQVEPSSRFGLESAVPNVRWSEEAGLGVRAQRPSGCGKEGG